MTARVLLDDETLDRAALADWADLWARGVQLRGTLERLPDGSALSPDLSRAVELFAEDTAGFVAAHPHMPPL